MIILSQDKETIVNLETLTGLALSESDGNTVDIVAVESFKDVAGRCLGEYATEERAKEILFGITQIYQSSSKLLLNNSMPVGGFTANTVYEMPQE